MSDLNDLANRIETEAPSREDWSVEALEGVLGALEGLHGNGWINISMRERRLFAKLLREHLRAIAGDQS